MMTRRNTPRTWAAIVGLVLVTALRLPSPAADPARPAEAQLKVGGEGVAERTLTAAALARLPRHTVSTHDHGGAVTFEGVALGDVARLAGLPLGEGLKGPELARYVVIEADDGYRAVFALAELDPAFSDRLILLADRRDGGPLRENEGALRVVVPGDKKFARWVRRVIALRAGKA